MGKICEPSASCCPVTKQNNAVQPFSLSSSTRMSRKHWRQARSRLCLISTSTGPIQPIPSEEIEAITFNQMDDAVNEICDNKEALAQKYLQLPPEPRSSSSTTPWPPCPPFQWLPNILAGSTRARSASSKCCRRFRNLARLASQKPVAGSLGFFAKRHRMSAWSDHTLSGTLFDTPSP
jgi:hypothetical protein